MRRYTLVTAEDDQADGILSEALYCDGKKILESDGEPLTASDVLDAIATSNVTVAAEYLHVTSDYDDEVVRFDGYPDALPDIPAAATEN